MDGADPARSSLCDWDSIAVVAEACGCEDEEAIDLLTVHHLSNKAELLLTRRCG